MARETRQTSARIEKPAPIRMPWSRSKTSTPAIVSAAAANSTRLRRQSRSRAGILIRLRIATSTTAASVASGSLPNGSVRKSSTMASKIAANPPASGVLAPASALTAERDMLPPTGNPWKIPAPMLIAPLA